MKDKKVENEEINLDSIKDELNLYIDKQVRKEINEELDKTTRKLIREKNKKILFRDLVIILLLCAIYYLFYLLYTNHYFDKNIITKPIIEEKKIQKKEIKEEKKEDLINKYSYLLDKIIINDKSKYLFDYYEGNLNKELKSYITFSNLEIENDNNVFLVDEETFKETYEKIFDDYMPVDFDYNGKEVSYIEKVKSFMINERIEKNQTRIKRNVVEVKEEDNNIEITTTEAIFKHNKVYNALTLEEIDEKDIDSYNKLTYVFNKDLKLIEIRKIK